MVYVALILFGLCTGSFVNALVYRLHEQSKKAKKRVDLSITKGRSICPHCKHRLSSLDLIPVFSWLSLGGKCRYCKKTIHWQYPVVELITAALMVSLYVFWPLEASESIADTLPIVNLVAWLFVSVGFIALVVYDLKWMLLPNRIVFPLLGIALVLAVINILFGGGLGVLSSTVLGVIVGGGLFFLLFHYSKGRWIGGGDVKLGLLSGLLLADPYLAFIMLFIASTVGTLFAIPLLISRKLNTNSRIPFGPFLILATILAKLFGGLLVEAYRNFVGI